jgi:GAF domain-containing protein
MTAQFTQPGFCSDKTGHASHYRLVSALAVQDAACQPVAAGDGVGHAGKCNLSSVAAAIDVPVVLATFPDENGVRTFATHGLDLKYNFARFGAVCNDLCEGRALVVPDIQAHPTLSEVTKTWPAGDVRFLVGIPLFNKTGMRVGSIAVMDTSPAVARKGISFGLLNMLAKSFTENGKIDAVGLKG